MTPDCVCSAISACNSCSLRLLTEPVQAGLALVTFFLTRTKYLAGTASEMKSLFGLTDIGGVVHHGGESWDWLCGSHKHLFLHISLEQEAKSLGRKRAQGTTSIITVSHPLLPARPRFLLAKLPT